MVVEASPVVYDDVEVFPFDADGGYRFVGVLRNYSQAGVITDAERVDLTLENNGLGVVYELTQAAGAITYPIEMELDQGEARVYAILPHAVDDVTASAIRTGNVVDVGGAVEVNGAPAGGPHVLSFEVSDPNDRPRPEYSRRLLTQAGQATYQFPLALNDRWGTWTVTVTDTVSGLSDMTQFTVPIVLLP